MDFLPFSAVVSHESYGCTTLVALYCIKPPSVPVRLSQERNFLEATAVLKFLLRHKGASRHTFYRSVWPKRVESLSSSYSTEMGSGQKTKYYKRIEDWCFPEKRDGSRYHRHGRRVLQRFSGNQGAEQRDRRTLLPGLSSEHLRP